MSVSGGGFTEDTDFYLEPAGGDPITSMESVIVSDRRADVVFSLEEAVEGGSYALVAEDADARDVVENAFGVSTSGVRPGLSVSFAVPTNRYSFRFSRTLLMRIRYENTGDREMVAPLLKVVGPRNSRLR